MAGEVYSCPACGEAMLCTPELEDLRAEVERLQTQEQNAGKLAVHHLERAMTAETRLAAAEALLRYYRTGEGPWNDDSHGCAAEDFLSTATQPTASAAPCTAEERAVLDAMARVSKSCLLTWEDGPFGDADGLQTLGVAELARRAAEAKLAAVRSAILPAPATDGGRKRS